MAEIPTYDARANRRGAPAVDQGDGGASTWLAIARASSAFAARIGQLADAKAEQEGYLAGLNARFQLPDPQFTEETPPQTGQRDDRAGPYNAGYGSKAPKVQASALGFAVERLMARGWSREQAAGIAGHLHAESGFAPDVIQGRRRGDQGTAAGVAQWRGKRLANLKAFARARKANWQDLGTQIDFIDYELRTSEGGAGAALKRATNVEAAVEAFMGFERPAGWTPDNPRGGHNFAGRLQAAMAAFGSGASSPGRGPAGAVQPFTAEPAAGAPSPTIQPIVLTRGISIRDQAFDRAALGTAADQLDVQAYTNLELIAAKYPGAPEQALEAIDAYASGVRGQLGAPELQARFDNIVARHRLAIVQEQSKIAEKARRDEREAAFLANWSERRTAVSRLARRLPSGEEGDAAVAQEMEEMEGLLSSAQDLTPKERASLQIGLAQDVGTARIMGEFDRLDSPQKRQAYLAAFEEEWTAGKGKSLKLTPETFAAIRSDMLQKLGEDQREADKAMRETSQRIETVITKLTKGYSATPEERTALKGAAEAHGDPALAESYRFMEALATWQATARQARPEDIQSAIEAEEARLNREGASAREIDALDAMKALHKTLADGVDKDMLGTAERMGVLKVPPLDPADFAGSLTRRKAAAETIAAHYGRPADYFRPGEVEQIQRTIAKEPEQLVLFARSLQEAFGDDDAAQALGEISKEAPLLAHAGGLAIATGSERLLRETAEALRRRQVEGYKPLTLSEAERRQTAFAALGPALTLLPETQASAMQMADMLFDLRATGQGLEPSADPAGARALYEQALYDALGTEGDTGGIAEINGMPTAIPPGMTGDQIAGALDLLTDDDLAKLPPFGAPDGVPVAALDLSNAHLIASGLGRYRVALGDPSSDDPRYLVTPDGRFYELEAAQLVALTKGRPIAPAPIREDADPFGGYRPLNWGGQ